MKISLEEFNNYLINKGLKNRTIENYLYYFNKFTDEFYNQETVSRFLSQKSNQNSIARSFLLNLKKYLLMNYRELGLEKLKPSIMEVELPSLTGRRKKREVNPLSKEEIARVLKYLPGEKEKLELLITYYGQGLRLGGLLKIKVISFNWPKWKEDPKQFGELRVFEKGDKERIVFIPSNIMERVAKYIYAAGLQTPDSYLFIHPTKENQKLKDLARTWQMKLRKAGIDSGVTQIGKNRQPIKETIVHPHRIRHSFASHFQAAQGDIRKTQEALGHSDISSTQIYTHVNRDLLKEDLKEFY